jgi:hypothetical protein
MAQDSLYPFKDVDYVTIEIIPEKKELVVRASRGSGPKRK